MKIPRHITDLGRGDFEEIARATNLQPGVGISVEKVGDGIRISLNETQFKQMLWAFHHNGGFAAQADEVEGVSLDIN